MEVDRLPLRPLTAPLLDVAVLDSSVVALAQSREIAYERGWRDGLGPYAAAAIDLASGAQCVLEEFEWADGVVVRAEPSEDQDDVLDAVLVFFGLDRSVVTWTAPRPFRAYGPTVCVLAGALDDLVAQHSLTLRTGSDANTGPFVISEIDVEGQPVLLSSRPEGAQYPGIEVRCRWKDDPAEMLAPVLRALELDPSRVSWTPGSDSHDR